MNLSLQPLQVQIYDSVGQLTCEGQVAVINQQIQVLYRENPIQLLHPELFNILCLVLVIETLASITYLLLEKYANKTIIGMFLRTMIYVRILVCIFIFYAIF